MSLEDRLSTLENYVSKMREEFQLNEGYIKSFRRKHSVRKIIELDEALMKIKDVLRDVKHHLGRLEGKMYDVKRRVSLDRIEVIEGKVNSVDRIGVQIDGHDKIIKHLEKITGSLEEQMYSLRKKDA